MDGCSEAGAGGRAGRRDLPAFRAVLNSFEPEGYDLDLDELFETGLRYLLNGFDRAT